MGRDGLGEAGHGGDGLETSVDGGGGGADGLGQFLAAGIGGIELQIAEDEPAGPIGPPDPIRPTDPTGPTEPTVPAGPTDLIRPTDPAGRTLTAGNIPGTVPQSGPPRQDLLHSPLKRHGYHLARLPHPDRYPVRGNVLPTKRQDV